MKIVPKTNVAVMVSVERNYKMMMGVGALHVILNLLAMVLVVFLRELRMPIVYKRVPIVVNWWVEHSVAAVLDVVLKQIFNVWCHQKFVVVVIRVVIFACIIILNGVKNAVGLVPL